MIRIAVTDDNEESSRTLCEMVSGYEMAHDSIAVSIASFSNGSLLINAIYEYGSFDLYFIEVQLKGEDGLELAKRIRQMDSGARIVFVSDTAEHALASYRVHAYDYILRPYDYELIWEDIDRMIIEIRDAREKMILIRNTDRGEELIPFHEILYAERSLRGMTVHLAVGRIVESVTLRSSFRNAVSELMKDSRFYLAGASMILNLEHIRGLRQECVLLRNGMSVIVPKRCFSDLRRAWIRHWQALELTEDSKK